MCETWYVDFIKYYYFVYTYVANHQSLLALCQYVKRCLKISKYVNKSKHINRSSINNPLFFNYKMSVIKSSVFHSVNCWSIGVVVDITTVILNLA